MNNKGSNTTKKKSGVLKKLVVLFLFLGISVVLINKCTAQSDESVASETEQSAADAAVTTAVDSSDTGDQSAAATSDVPSNDNGYETVSTRSQTYRKNKDGIYELTGPVMDTANVLSDAEYNELDAFLRNLDKTTGVQIAVLTVQSLDGESIESYSIKHAESWHLGQKGVDNGALLTVAMEEHGLRIETGYGTEGTLTDAKCAQLIRDVLVPAFKSGDYGKGIVSCAKNMAGIITSNKELVTVKDGAEEDSSTSVFGGKFLMFWVVVFTILFIVLLAFIFHAAAKWFPNTKFGSFAGNYLESSKNATTSSSSDDSFSGGGGSFGGGGASGSW